MKQIRLGGSDLTVGQIGYGCWRLDEPDPRRLRDRLEVVVEAGINLVDTADVYGPLGGLGFGGAESVLGQVLAESPALRNAIVLATKGGIRPATTHVTYNLSAGYLVSACEASLRRLQVDVIDLYQLHRPDYLAHPEEVAGAVTRLREQGKVREVGVSNHSAAQTRALQRCLGFKLVASQLCFSALCLDPLGDGTLEYCVEHGITPLAWSPLAGGELMTRCGISESDSLRFILAHPARPVPIIGTRRAARIRRCAAAADEPNMERDEWYGVLAAVGHGVP